MKYYIGADLGTSALKLLLVGEDGTIAYETQREYEVYFPRSSWSEQNPNDWWTAFKDGIKEITNKFNPNNIFAIGVAGQMHGLVALDNKDNVIRPAILWNDSRTEKETEYLNSVIGKDVLSSETANIAFAGFTAPKILWLKNNEYENFCKTEKIMLPKDYINYLLTGVHCCDYSDASGMLLLDVKNKRWSEKMLNICSLKESQLPKLYESYQVIGTLLPDIAKELNLNETVKVVAGAGDNAAAAIGTNTLKNGKCNISLGTSGTAFISNDNFCVDEQNALHSFCHASGKYHLMACILSAASCNKWFCDNILQTNDYSAEQRNITEEMLGNNEVFFLPYLMGERSPINDVFARGTFTGMTMNTKRSDMILAVLEGVAFAIKDNIEIAKEQGINIQSSCLCGGGAKSELWQKILCNVLNIEIVIPTTEQGPGYGAAMLAMVGDNAFENIEECAEKFFNIKSTLLPKKEIAKRYEEKYIQFKNIYPSLKVWFAEKK